MWNGLGSTSFIDGVVSVTVREQLGWRIPRDERDAFEEFVAEKWDAQGPYVRFEIESAMREFLDADGDLAEAEALLRKYLHSRGLSSSTDAVPSRIDHGDTVKLGHRVNADLKAEFAQMAKQRYDDSLGAVLARALNAYRGGGRERRILENVKQLFAGGTTGGSDDDPDESRSAAAHETGTTSRADESSAGPTENATLSSAARSGTTGVVDESSQASGEVSGTSDGSDETVSPEPQLVMEIAEDLGKQFPRSKLEETIAKTVGGDGAVFEAYRDAVLDYKNVVQKPHTEVYIPKEEREQGLYWCDMTKEIRITKLRRLLVLDALKQDEQRRALTYREVQDLFEHEFGKGPSHDYAYTLMEEAAKLDGFRYGDYRGQKQIRVNLRQVKQTIINEVVDKHDHIEPSELTVNGLITSYTAGDGPEQEGAADD